MGLGTPLLIARQFVTSPGPHYTSSYYWHKWKERSKILATPPVATNPDGLFSIRYLLCHSQILEGTWSAKSLLVDRRFREGELVFHDDGSLTRNDVRLLEQHFPRARIMIRNRASTKLRHIIPAHGEETDEVMRKILPPLCWNLRTRSVFGLKLFDVAHFSRGKPYLLIDSDVLFFSNPEEIYQALSRSAIRWNRSPEGTMSLCDEPPTICNATRLNPDVRFNSGLIVIPKPFTDWEQIETWLDETGLMKTPTKWLHAFEQTMYALIAAKTGGEPLSEMYDTCEQHRSEVISEHYYWLSRLNMYRRGYPAIRPRLAA